MRRNWALNCSFISVTGKDEPANYVKKELEKENIPADLIIDEDRQTTFKIRYMVGKQKILRVSRLQEHSVSVKLQDKIIERVNQMADKLDGIIISDFVYGVITPDLLKKIEEISQKHNIKLFGDSQSSSQIGDVSKFTNFDLITPTEREARIALSDKFNGLEKIGINLLDKTGVKNLLITLAEKGFVAFQAISRNGTTLAKSQHFPALEANPADVVRQGILYYPQYHSAYAQKPILWRLHAMPPALHSIAVSKVGNVPVSQEELKNLLNQLNREL
ncbi:MAG: PfkB family carbohydrate kinase [Ignavibacteriales bacterium]|nr:PfkB family carbohydrate kinase [Ignavibacteriales bacterium]